MQRDIGLIGLALMDENLVTNMESRGFSVAVFNRTTAVTQQFVLNAAQSDDYGESGRARRRRDFADRAAFVERRSHH